MGAQPLEGRMAENEAPQGATPKDETPQAPKPAPPAQEETDWKAEARKHEAREKEWKAKAEANEAAAKALTDLENASKSDLEKAIKRATDAEAKLAKFEQRDQVQAWAEEITKDTHVSPALLRGTTRDELEAHFKELSAAIPTPAGETPAPQGKPVTTIGQQPAGARSVPLPEQIAAAEKAGDKALVSTLKAMQLGAVPQPT